MRGAVRCESSVCATATLNACGMVQIHLEFGGGLDSIVVNRAKHVHVDAPVVTLGELITWVRRHQIAEKHDMFAVGEGAIRPGVLVLVNETDWEIEGTVKCRVSDGDHIAFISTLHGG